ncbi:ATP-binding cassette domain-containing protein [Mastigocladus laminosus UU774]|nr:ATP-binding cassette domain-containing protein [Mastigocladus laminosus UU774]
MSAEPSLLKLENVSFYYTKNNKILDNVNFNLLPGEQVGIIGNNGSGKSTIAKLLLGIHTPQKGTVNLFGKQVLWSKHYPLLGYIGDPSHNSEELGLPIGILVEEVIKTFKNLLNYSQHNNELCDELIEKLKLDKLYCRDVGKLSKGERRKLMAFLALGKEIKLLIADEATEGLDDEVEKLLLTVIKERVKKKKIGMLWISHRRNEIINLTNSVFCIKNGKLTYLENYPSPVDRLSEIKI